MAANTPTNGQNAAAGSVMVPVMQKVMPPLIWMGIGAFAMFILTKPKRSA